MRRKAIVCLLLTTMTAATVVIVIVSLSGSPSERQSTFTYQASASQLVNGSWNGSGPEEIHTTTFPRTLPGRLGLTVSAVISSGVDSAGSTYLLLADELAPKRDGAAAFLTTYSPKGTLVQLARLPAYLNCNPQIRHVDPLIVDCTFGTNATRGEVAELSPDGRVLWHRRTSEMAPNSDPIVFVGYASRHRTEFYAWGAGPESTSDAVTTYVVGSRGEVIQSRSFHFPADYGSQVGLQWYAGGWIELTVGQSSATLRRFTPDFKIVWSRQVPIGEGGGDDELGPLVVGGAIYFGIFGIGGGSVEVGRVNLDGSEVWLRSINIGQVDGLVGPFRIAASSKALWVTGFLNGPLVGNSGGPSAPDYVSILRLDEGTGNLQWTGRVLAQYPTAMSAGSKQWSYFQPDNYFDASGCRLSVVLDGNDGSRTIRLPVAASVTVSTSKCL
jgi:hypothetical protein